MRNALLFLFILTLTGRPAAGQRLGVYAVGFYNVENLFDTEKDPDVQFGAEDFTPKGPYAWTPEKYRKKLANTASVIAQLGKEHSPAGVAVLGVSEIENRRVLEDLVATGELARVGYGIVHYDSPDRRGVDVGLIYNPSLFTPISSVPYRFHAEQAPNYVTRDHLLVSGIMGGDTLHVIVGHWPSRYGGEKESSPMRESAAAIARHIADSLHAANPGGKVVIMGDLNDDPTSRSVRVVLDAKYRQGDVPEGGLFNATRHHHERGIGSLAYQGKWNLFDQIIISQNTLGKDYASLKYWKTEIFNRDFLLSHEGRNKGYPHRTFSNNTFIDGYSDHLPVLIYLVKRQ